MNTTPTQTQQTLTQYNPGIIPAFPGDIKDFTSWAYANVSCPLNLGGHEYDSQFITDQLTKKVALKMVDVFITFFREKHPEQVELLQDEEKTGFEWDLCLRAMSSMLKEKSYERAEFLTIFREVFNHFYENELEKNLNTPFFKAFCDGLGLNKACRALFFLCLMNALCGWIFPEKDNHRYNSHIFCCLLGEKIASEFDFCRKINNKLGELGLFSAPWRVRESIAAAFTGGIPDCSLSRVQSVPFADVYDYRKVYRENKAEADIAVNTCKSFILNQAGCIQLVSAEQPSRARLFLNSICESAGLKLYVLEQKVPELTAEAAAFNLYIYSLTVNQKNSVIFVGGGLSDLLCKETAGRNGSVFSGIKVPVFLYTRQADDGTVSQYEKRGIHVCNTLNVKFADSALSKENAKIFFASINNPAFIKPVVDLVNSQKTDPDDWQKLLELTKASSRLSPDEFKTLLERNYPDKNDTNAAQLRKNSHYSLDALNTSMAPSELTKCIRNAIMFQKKEYNAESGSRYLLKGPSGTGKTAFVEEVSKHLEMPLIITTASDYLGSYVGQTEHNIKAIFQKAAETHSILLVDEADSLIHGRGDRVNRHNDSKVNEFLTQMERFPGILFCSTNFAENLDKATDRRFDFKIEFKPLTREGVSLLVASYFGKYGLSDEQVRRIYNAGDVVPGDFNVVNRQIRFMDKKSVTADYITDELCRTVSGKKRSYERTIGFGA